MKCKTCGTNYRKIDTLLVCENGHTLQNTTEVVDDEVPGLMRGKSKTISRKKKPRVIYKSDGCKMMRAILMKLLFDEFRLFLNIKSDIMFKYFTEFFEFKDSKLDTNFEMSRTALVTLTYLAKRAEMEDEGQIYMYYDFIHKFRRFDWSGTLEIIRRKIPALTSETIAATFRRGAPRSPMIFKPWLDDLTSVYSACRSSIGPFRKSDTGILEENIETAKYNMRRFFRNDVEFMRKYFDAICSELEVEMSPELIFYFEKFIYTYDPGNIIFPDYDFPFLIMSYLISRNCFANTRVEANIFEYLRITKTNLKCTYYNPFVSKLDAATTPESYVSYRNRKNKSRFTGLIESIEFIDGFKRLVAEDMLNVLLFNRKKQLKWDKLVQKSMNDSDNSDFEN